MAVHMDALKDEAAARGFRAFTSSLEDKIAHSVAKGLGDITPSVMSFGTSRLVGVGAAQLALALVSDSLPPEGMEAVMLDCSEEEHEANALRERVMCERIRANG